MRQMKATPTTTTHRLRALDQQTFGQLADLFAVGVAVSLPWSSTATGVLIVLWLLTVLPALDTAAIRPQLTSAAGGGRHALGRRFLDRPHRRTWRISSPARYTPAADAVPALAAWVRGLARVLCFRDRRARLVVGAGIAAAPGRCAHPGVW